MKAGTFAGISTENRVIHIIDPLTAGNDAGYGMGYLRSLPLLLENRVERFTFPKGWLSTLSNETFDAVAEKLGDNRFRYTAIPELSFEYTLIGTEQQADTLELSQLCQVTSQQLEENQYSVCEHTTNNVWPLKR